MVKNRYNKSLTVILIIVIIAIIGLLIYFGIDVYRRYYIERAAGDAVQEFEDTINQIASTTQNVTATDDGSSIIDVNGIGSGTTTQTSGSSSVTYMGYDVIGIIEIPSNDIKYPILADYEMSVNAMTVAIIKMYPSTIDLNEVGNTVLVGHNYRNGSFFSNNKRLENGDLIYITDLSGNRVAYEVYNKYETSSSDSEYMKRDTDGKREISLSTCTDDSSMRLIIWAREVE